MSRIRVPSYEEWHVDAPETLGINAIKVHEPSKRRFEAVVHFRYNATEIWVDKWTEGGTNEGSWAVQVPRPNTKFDNVSIDFLGNDLLVSTVAHDLTTRAYPKVIARIVGVLP